jgi:hypothetical protein
MGRRVSRCLRLGTALLLLLATAAPAMAAEDEEDLPYFDVPVQPVQKPWRQWLFGSGFAALCLFIAFKNPHRSHLD